MWGQLAAKLVRIGVYDELAEAGKAAGIPTVGLVLTGRGAQQVETTEYTTLKPFPIYSDLAEALESLIP